MCRACYAFAAIGSLESFLVKYKNQTLDLSEQNIIDCTIALDNSGCYQGYIETTFDYMKGGIMSEQDYPVIFKILF